jgi:hypothetical protein
MTQAKWDTLALQVGVRLTIPPKKILLPNLKAKHMKQYTKVCG